MLSEAQEKLSEDLRILEQMAGEMDSYLPSDVLFWPMMGSNLPQLTLGGYLMREHRLLALAPTLLDEAEQGRLQTAVFQFNQQIAPHTVRLEQKAATEIEARLRQWQEYLRDVQKGKESRAFYKTAMEPRAMLAAILDKLSFAPYQLNPEYSQRLQALDIQLRRRWHPGEFAWPEGWELAYPKEQYWWLYGWAG